MLYYLYEWNHAMLTPMRIAADATRIAFQNPLNPASQTPFGRAVAAGAELFERTTRVYAKPRFNLTETVVDNVHVPVEETVVLDKPFCRLLHFERKFSRKRRQDPKFLIVAPLSGHYATLLRGTVEALLPHADVCITDWKDARTVPVGEGRFDLDDYTQYVIDFLRELGPDVHVLGVCQPAVPVLMAVAHMEKHDDPCHPATMTLMGGPIDTRVNPTAVNELAEEKGIDWFRENVIMTVPFPQPGFGRPVYPGFLQLTGFMSMNLDRHMKAHKDFFWHLVKDDGDSAEKHRTFYDEYNAVMDMTAEFYLQTVEEVFIKHSLPTGTMPFKGATIDLSAIRRVALLTVEGENDDISGVGQTEAAQDICTNIPEDMRVHYVQPKVGHYGVFNGSRFRSEIVPRIVDFALTHGKTHGTANLPKKTEITQRKGRNFGAHAERKAKAGQLGRSLATGGETGIADPIMFANNPFAAGERMMRAFSTSLDEALDETPPPSAQASAKTSTDRAEDRSGDGARKAKPDAESAVEPTSKDGGVPNAGPSKATKAKATARRTPAASPVATPGASSKAAKPARARNRKSSPKQSPDTDRTAATGKPAKLAETAPKAAKAARIRAATAVAPHEDDASTALGTGVDEAPSPQASPIPASKPEAPDLAEALDRDQAGKGDLHPPETKAPKGNDARIAIPSEASPEEVAASLSADPAKPSSGRAAPRANRHARRATAKRKK